ncbi:MAG: hypothetical protein R2941_04105 [Desulfobacterales bacterium]
MKKQTVFKILVPVLFSFLMSNTALAHKVTVFAWVEGNTVCGEGKFSGGRKAQGAEVAVYDPAGKRLLTTKTDENGSFSFPVPQKTAMKIELLAGMGHKGEWTIPLEEVTAAADTDRGGERTGVHPDAKLPENSEKSSEKSTDAGLSEISAKNALMPDLPDREELQKMIQTSVEKSLDEKLKPVIRMLADSQQKGPALNEIVGGIGYIFGIMGLALYFRAKKKGGLPEK